MAYTWGYGLSGSAAAYARLEKVTLPGGRQVYYNYESSDEFKALGRVANIAANGSPTDAQKYVAYKYLGASMVVDANHPAVPTGLKLTYAGAASGDYSGLDRFGRVVWQRWLRSNGASAADRHFYGYDRAGNRTWRAERANLSDAGGRDEAYVYDKLDRLIGAKRGILPDKPYQAPYPGDATLDGTVDLSDYTVLSLNWLGSGKTWTQADFNGDGKVDGFDNTILGDNWLTDPNETVARSWSWSLTPTGNWSSSMINDANQTRTHDNANQITSISGVALAPLYDQAGNNVRGPRPADPNANNAAHFRYDAWNRMAKVYLDDGDTAGTLDPNDQLLEACQYDGLMRRTARVTREAVGATPVWRRTDYYHNENWQVVEEWRRTMPVGADPQGTYICSHSALSVYAQYVWDLSYIDSPVCRVRSTETVYYTFDGNRNVTALLNASTGSVVERYLYDPYGRVTVLNGAAGAEKDPNVAEWSPDADNKSDWDNEILFCGYRYDPETGNYIARRRYLTPPLGRWITREPLLGNTPGSGYHDGVNVYQYVVGSPTQRLDPQGLRSLTWIPCSGKTLVVMTDYCCYEDQRKIEKAVCGAYTALVATNAALWNHQNTRPWTTENSFTHHRVLDYFHDGQEYDDKGGGNLGEDISADAKMRGLVNRVRGVTYALEDRLDDSSGTLYQCDGKKGACATARAWVRPYSGYAVHICHLFLHGSEDSPNWLRAKTIIHELSHLYEQTTDSGTYGPWQSGGMGGDTATYIRGENEAGIPQYYNPRKRLSTWPDGQPRVDGPGHADTIAEFVMNWYK